MVEEIIDDILSGVRPKLTQCIVANLRSLVEGNSLNITVNVHLKCTERQHPEFFSCNVDMDK
jgi:hypothetical protein